MSEVIIARKNTLKKWGVGLKNKDKKGKEQIKKTKFSDIDLFEEGHEEEPDELDLIDGLIKDPATTQDKEHNAICALCTNIRQNTQNVKNVSRSGYCSLSSVQLYFSP